MNGLQFGIGLFDHRCFAVLLIQFDLQISHRSITLLHFCHVDAPMRQMNSEIGIVDHVVLIVGIHISTFGIDGS